MISPLNLANTVSFSGSKQEPTTEELNYSNAKIDKAYDKYEGKIEKAKQNVHPATVIIAAVAGFFTLSKGTKLVGIARRAIAPFAGKAANKALDLGNLVSTKLFKKAGIANLETIKSKVSDVAQKAHLASAKDNNTKMVERFQQYVDNAFIEKGKGAKFTEWLNNKGIVISKAGLFDAGIAGAAAIKTVDTSSDTAENVQDGIDVKQAGKELAKELSDILL